MRESWTWTGLSVLGATLGLLALAGIVATTVLAEEPAAPVAPPAVPKFSVALSQQDLPNVREVCSLAQRSLTLTLEQATGVGSFCVDFLRRLGQGLSGQGAAPAPAGPGTGEKEGQK
jgi:hypothetical protein